MKVEFLEDYTVAIDGIRFVDFKAGEIHDLPNDKAELYASRGKCKPYQEAIKIETAVIQPVIEKKPLKLKKKK